MKMQGIMALAAMCATLSACGTIIEGTSQDIAISSAPDGARCELTRKEERLTSVTTPGKVTVRKTKDDILLTCSKAGYQNTSQYLHSGMAAGTFGNIIAGGVIGWGIDSATGADNKYPESVTVSLSPTGATVPAPANDPVVRNNLLPGT